MADKQQTDLHYYSVLPAHVRLDTTIKDSDKVLLAEITLICSLYGHCIYENAYFANLFNISERSISRRLSRLEKENYITRDYITIRSRDKKERKRIIKLSDKVFMNHQD